MQVHEIFNIKISDLNDHELGQKLLVFLNSGRAHLVATPNAEMFLDAKNDSIFKQALMSTDLNLPDSVSMRFAISALTDQELQNRHTGVDTFQSLVNICQTEKRKVLLFGASEEILNKTRSRLLDSYEYLDVEILDPGYLIIRSGWIYVRDEVIDEINAIKPDVIALALSHKKQLIFMNQFRDWFPSVKIIIGIGGALDMISGKYKRAPRLMRKIGLEWLWRVLMEPSRIGRILSASIAFPIYVVIETIRKHRFIKAVINTLPEITKQLIGK